MAERFFRGIYGGDPSVVDELAAQAITLSYPIFAELFDAPVIRGRDAVQEFARGFGERWADPHITIHESVVEGDNVVLIWSFRALNVGSSEQGSPPSNREHTWGGISLFRFDLAGRIVAEIGEESTPGPFHRSSTSD